MISKEEQERLKFRELRKQLNALEAAFPALSEAQIIVSESEPRETHVYLRGNYRAKGIAVQPGTLSVLPADGHGIQTHPDLHSRNGLTSPDNPLTASVTVNRVWQELFGRGTGSQFGEFRITRRKTVASGAAGLAGERFHGSRLEFQARREDDRDVGSLSPVLRGPAASRKPMSSSRARPAYACPPS